MSALLSEPFPQADAVLDRVLAAHALDPRETICVTGPCALEMLGALCRRGFRRVEIARRATCPCADDTCSTLLVGLVEDPRDLEEALDRIALMLREGGLLLVDLSGLRSAWDRAVASRMVRQAGFTRSSTVDAVLSARKLPRIRRRAA